MLRVVVRVTLLLGSPNAINQRALTLQLLEHKQRRSPRGGPVTRVTPTRVSTALTFDCCCGEQQVTVNTVPDLEKARKWRATLKRVQRVDIHINGDHANCIVVGLGHRLPVSRPVPLAVALGFAVIGDPLHVTIGER